MAVQNGLDATPGDADPWALFERWLEEARQAGPAWAEVMVLATATRDGRPSARAVVLRHLGPSGLAFDTDYQSRKAEEIRANPRAAAVFLWPQIERQVRFQGNVSAVPHHESDQRFEAAPRDQKLAIWASPQSHPVEDRNELSTRLARVRLEYDGRPVPRPARWGGYRLSPEEVEFWQGRSDRLHDRLLYRLQSDGRWNQERLSP